MHFCLRLISPEDPVDMVANVQVTSVDEWPTQSTKAQKKN